MGTSKSLPSTATLKPGESTTSTAKIAPTTTVMIPRTGWQEVSVSTIPGSRCILPDSTGQGMTIYADNQGEVEMFVRETSSTAGLNTQLTCQSGAETTVFPLVYRTRADSAAGILPPTMSSGKALSTDEISAGINRLGFDPRTLNNAALLSRNLPARVNMPENSEQYQAWLRAALIPTTRIVQTGVPTDIYHGPAVAGPANSGCTAPGSGIGKWNAYSANWSGYQGNGSQGTFGIVQAEWNMPSAAVLLPSGKYYDSVWVGIDGGCTHSPYPTSNDVFQTGTDTEVSSNGSTQTGVFWIWYEYYPNPSYLAFYTAPYNTDYCDVQRGPKSFYCKDESTGATEIASDPSASINGNTAEWIVERPCCASKNVDYYLVNYGTTAFSEAGAQLTNGVGYAYSQLSSAWALYNLTLVDPYSGDVDSYTADAGTSTFLTIWSGYH